ncbi:hypothetical protein GOP47_0016987 [Adiantum capillus-veneris]|uniref:Uncharacterized protein n=1 Tax=Adiantum capillus-veneris TaxID=13818 RepID=A0A9D4UJ33_ADICA|nr:hypothetical protein GOP47_0016987 [Adiantum capillus-veneris]
MKAKKTKKEEVAKAKEEKRLEKEAKKKEALAEKETSRQRREDAQQAKQARQNWEIQQQQFGNHLRSVLWEGGSLRGLVYKPLHMDQPFHATARRKQLEKIACNIINFEQTLLSLDLFSYLS